MAGMDPMRFLETDDPIEALVMAGIAKRWYERKEQLDQQLAIAIINKLGESMK